MKRILIPCILLTTIIGCSQPSEKRINEQEIVIKLESVKIGAQIWTTKNLSVDTFRNGELIPEAKTAKEWQDFNDNKRPAWCSYNFDPVNDSLYGKLYNWYAVNDSMVMAPMGWHVASNEEWKVLIDLAGGISAASKKLKAKIGWTDHSGSSDNNGTDDYGFMALPNGEIHRDGEFSSLGSMGVWWTSSTYDDPVSFGDRKSDFAWDIVIWYSETMRIKRQRFPKRGSGAVRCVKNQ